MSDISTVGEIQSRSLDDVTVKTVVGSPSVLQYREALDDIYRNQPTIQVVWDVRKGSTANLSADDLRFIANLVKQRAHARAGGKTAIIAPSDLEYGMGRMLQAFSEIEEIPVQFRVFRAATEAEAWLGIDVFSDS